MTSTNKSSYDLFSQVVSNQPVHSFFTYYHSAVHAHAIHSLSFLMTEAVKKEMMSHLFLDVFHQVYIPLVCDITYINVI